jgi:3D-(3,5/4)-trihydroxycyclohexane-1,2-dione acylhydrolase (decyclizing)
MTEAVARANAAKRSYVFRLHVDSYEGWTAKGGAWRKVEWPEVSDNAKVVATCTTGNGHKVEGAGI